MPEYKAIADSRLRLQFASIIHDDESQTAWFPLANTLEILRKCCSTAPASTLPTPRAIWPVMWKGRHPQNRKYMKLYCRQKRTESWPQVTCTENFVKFGNMDF